MGNFALTCFQQKSTVMNDVYFFFFSSMDIECMYKDYWYCFVVVVVA